LSKGEDVCLEITSLALGRLQSGDFYAKSYFLLGKISEQKGSVDKAKEYYGKFLDLWSNADLGLQEVEEAKKNLAALK
jgi:hypothetical protein